MALIDTHSIIKELIDAGTSEKEAEVFVKRFAAREEFSYLKNDLATKYDIHELKSDISKLENKMDINMRWIMAISGAMFLMLVKLVFFNS